MTKQLADEMRKAIDALNEKEAKAAFLWLLGYIVENTPCLECALFESDECYADDETECAEKFLSAALKGDGERWTRN